MTTLHVCCTNAFYPYMYMYISDSPALQTVAVYTKTQANATVGFSLIKQNLKPSAA